VAIVRPDVSENVSSQYSGSYDSTVVTVESLSEVDTRWSGR
jgi:hypothetical protein